MFLIAVFPMPRNTDAFNFIMIAAKSGMRGKPQTNYSSEMSANQQTPGNPIIKYNSGIRENIQTANYVKTPANQQATNTPHLINHHKKLALRDINGHVRHKHTTRYQRLGCNICLEYKNRSRLDGEQHRIECLKGRTIIGRTSYSSKKKTVTEQKCTDTKRNVQQPGSSSGAISTNVGSTEIPMEQVVLKISTLDRQLKQQIEECARLNELLKAKDESILKLKTELKARDGFILKLKTMINCNGFV